MEIRQGLLEGRLQLRRLGEVQTTEDPRLPYRVVDGENAPIVPVNAFLGELILSDASPLTCRSYGYDLLRWWRVLMLLDVAWDKASRVEVWVLVGWLRSAPNPQRRRSRKDVDPPGAVNVKTGKPRLRAGYAASTINHALASLWAFYDFHLHGGAGPLVNPVPEAAERRAVLSHRSPLEAPRAFRRAPLRQRGCRSAAEVDSRSAVG